MVTGVNIEAVSIALSEIKSVALCRNCLKALAWRMAIG